MMSLVSAIKDFISGSKDKIAALEAENAELQKKLDEANEANARWGSQNQTLSRERDEALALIKQAETDATAAKPKPKSQKK